VTIYDVGKDGNIYYIVMEFVDGKPLNQIIAERAPLDYREVVHIGMQIASALSFAHRHNIIHRDVKPHNILVSGEDDETAKITDFGIARAVTDRTTVNDAGMIMGSVHYFSPEQGRGQYVDDKSDIYSLGVVLYEMLTGRVPFDADNPVAIAVMHMNNPIVPPSRLVGNIPPGLERIILKATEKYQSSRFKSVDDMLEALRNTSFVTGANDAEFDQGIYYAELDSDGTFRPEIEQGNNYGLSQGEGDDMGNGYGIGGGHGIPSQGVKPRGRRSSPPVSDEPDFMSVDLPDFPEYDGDAGSEGYARDSEDGHSSYVFSAHNAVPGEDEEGADDEASGGKRKKTIITAAILAVVLALVFGGLLFYILKIAGGGSVDVPNVTGMELEAAVTMMETEGFDIEIENVNSAIYDEGTVFRQEPRGGDKAKKNSTVKLIVSLGPDTASSSQPVDEEAAIPDLAGKTQAQATYMAQSVGFTIGNVSYADSDMAIDTVIDQSPKPGERAKTGGKIDITLSQGPRVKEVEMPNLIGKTETEARTAIETLRLVVGNVESAYSTDYQKGQVMWQQFAAGVKISEGQTINFKVSLGPEIKESTVHLTIDFTNAPADMFLLSVLQIGQDGSQNYVVYQGTTYRNLERFRGEGSENIQVTGIGQGKVIVYFNDAEAKVYNIDFTTGNVS
jgi:serine/threonine-protein kinase